MPKGSDVGKPSAWPLRILFCAMAIGALPLVSSPGHAANSQIDRKCSVFATAKDRARCACALEQGGWVTKVQGRWRWIYPRRHQERYCHGRVR